MSASDPSWVWPFWLERQLDPASPDFVPGTAGPELVNLTHRDAVLVGTVASPERAAVDPRGLVTPLATGWSLDWWIGAEDRWHVPSRATAVRQRLLDGSPVVETAMRVPGGDAIARAYGIQSTAAGPCAVVEIENGSGVPFAVVVAIRPFGPLGHVPIHDIRLDGATVSVDGVPALLLARPPGRVALANQEGGDSATRIFAGQAPPVGSHGVSVRCEAGWATGSFVFPLAHTAVARVVVPLAAGPVGRRRERSAAVAFPDAVPSAAQVAAGWVAQSRRAPVLSLPDDRIMAAHAAAVRHLLLVHGGDDLVLWPDGGDDLDAGAVVLDALGAAGFADEVEQVLRGWADRQALDGSFEGADGRTDATTAVLAAVGRHWQRTRDAALVEDLIGPLAKAAHWLEKRRTGRRVRRDPGTAGLLPTSSAPAWAGPPGTYLRDSALAARALRTLAPALDAAGQPDVAAGARRSAAALVEALDVALAEAAAATGGPVPPTPARRLDAGTVANLSLAEPLGVHRPTEPAVAATVDLVVEHLTLGPAVVQGVGHAGLSPDLTMQLALVEIERGDPAAIERLGWMVDVGGETAGWPQAVHPGSGGGSWGRPQDPVATARFTLAVRRLLVREIDDDAGAVVGLALCSVVAPRWLGQSIDVRDAPTALGTCSYSVRWHGDRPALFWEVDPHPGVTHARITAPGLDPTWSSDELHGEALLAPVPVPAELLADGPADEGRRAAATTFPPTDGPPVEVDLTAPAPARPRPAGATPTGSPSATPVAPIRVVRPRAVPPPGSPGEAADPGAGGSFS